MAIVGVQKGAGGEDGFQNGVQEVAKTVQDGAKMGQDAAKTRENESNKCGHRKQIRCFRKVLNSNGKAVVPSAPGTLFECPKKGHDQKEGKKVSK